MKTNRKKLGLNYYKEIISENENHGNVANGGDMKNHGDVANGSDMKNHDDVANSSDMKNHDDVVNDGDIENNNGVVNSGDVENISASHNWLKIYVLDINELDGNYYDRMPEYRRNKVDKMKHQEDKLRSLAAGVLLMIGLNDAKLITEEEYKNIREEDFITYGENGKPYLKNGNCYFNLSHSGDMAMLALSDKEVGCDVEKMHYKTTERLVHRFFTEEENKVFIAMESEEDKADYFTRVWTIKESFMKVTGEGMKRSPRSFTVRLSGNKPEVVEINGSGKISCGENSSDKNSSEKIGFVENNIDRNNCREKYRFWQLEIDDGYRFSVGIRI